MSQLNSQRTYLYLLYNEIIEEKDKPSVELVTEIFKEAVKIEKEFI